MPYHTASDAEDWPWIAAWTAQWLREQRLSEQKEQPSLGEFMPPRRSRTWGGPSFHIPQELEFGDQSKDSASSVPSDGESPLARTVSYCVGREIVGDVKESRQPFFPSIDHGIPEQHAHPLPVIEDANHQPRFASRASSLQSVNTPVNSWGATPSPWSPQHKAKPASVTNDGQHGQSWSKTPSPWSPHQRRLAEDIDGKVWDRAEGEAVNNILRNKELPRMLIDLTDSTMESLLRPRGYQLPAEQQELLGRGSFGRVTKVCRSSDVQPFAMKRQFLGDFAHDVIPVLREVSILNVLRGAKHIVQIQEAFLVRPTSGTAEVWAILEFFPHNLSGVHDQFRNEESARWVIFQLLLGLQSLHSADIVHRDLKPANVLIDLGSNPPRTVRAAICDFGISRSVHGFPEEEGCCDSEADLCAKPLRRTVTTHVTSSFWRAPEMWGWADASHMTKKDLKSLDIFGLGLIWAGLLGNGLVIQCDEDDDPPRFRLLEILQKVDRPSEEDLKHLSFKEGEQHFIQCLLEGDIAALLPEMVNEDYPNLAQRREDLLCGPFVGIRKWITQRARRPPIELDSPSLSIIENMCRFSYRRRPAVEAVLNNNYFSDLRSASPPQLWKHKLAPAIDDVREALDAELDHQVAALKHHDRRLAGRWAEDSADEAGSEHDEAEVKASVHRVNNLVRAELDRSSRW